MSSDNHLAKKSAGNDRKSRGIAKPGVIMPVPAALPDMTGFSPRNLKYMRKFAESWPDQSIVQRTVAQIPWRSNLTLLDKLNNPETRLW